LLDPVQLEEKIIMLVPIKKKEAFYRQSMTIGELVKKENIPPTKVNRIATINGKDYELSYFIYRSATQVESQKFKLPKDYQRTISKQSILNYGDLKPTMLTAVIIAVRPDGTMHCVEGMHRTFMFQNCILPDNLLTLPCHMYHHPTHLTEQECIQIEAEIFTDNNENRKKLSQMTKIRAGVVHFIPEDCWVLTVLERMNCHIDGFGSVKPDRLEIVGPNQFYYMVYKARGKSAFYSEGVNSMESEKTIQILIEGLKRYKQKWSQHCPDFAQNKIHASVLRAQVLEYMFVSTALQNGKRVHFEKFISEEIDGLFRLMNLKKLKKIISAHGLSDRLYLDWVCDEYNDWNDTKVLGIGPETRNVGYKKSKGFFSRVDK
jgi:hypothetical protein|tara:strand:+ start:1205 stop:2329 length:1125 start_codon:yes stop_codon:yes gene_type:complete